jgi:hypothetical protein
MASAPIELKKRVAKRSAPTSDTTTSEPVTKKAEKEPTTTSEQKREVAASSASSSSVAEALATSDGKELTKWAGKSSAEPVMYKPADLKRVAHHYGFAVWSDINPELIRCTTYEHIAIQRKKCAVLVKSKKMEKHEFAAKKAIEEHNAATGLDAHLTDIPAYTGKETKKSSDRGQRKDSTSSKEQKNQFESSHDNGPKVIIQYLRPDPEQAGSLVKGDMPAYLTPYQFIGWAQLGPGNLKGYWKSDGQFDKTDAAECTISIMTKTVIPRGVMHAAELQEEMDKYNAWWLAVQKSILNQIIYIGASEYVKNINEEFVATGSQPTRGEIFQQLWTRRLKNYHAIEADVGYNIKYERKDYRFVKFKESEKHNNLETKEDRDRLLAEIEEARASMVPYEPLPLLDQLPGAREIYYDRPRAKMAIPDPPNFIHLAELDDPKPYIWNKKELPNGSVAALAINLGVVQAYNKETFRVSEVVDTIVYHGMHIPAPEASSSGINLRKKPPPGLKFEGATPSSAQPLITYDMGGLSPTSYNAQLAKRNL